MQNWTQTLLSRFAGSPVLVSLISSFNAAMDPAAEIQNFYRYIWNVRTAVGNGLDIWGKIVNISRVVPSPVPLTLEDPDYQTLILVKAAANIGNVTVPTLNKLLQQIFAGSGIVYVQDNLDMTMSYVFLFSPTPAQQAIIEYSGAMPRPAGVLVNYVTTPVHGPLNTDPLNTDALNTFNLLWVFTMLKKFALGLWLSLAAISSAPVEAGIQVYSNNAVTTLAANASSSTTTLTVASSSLFPTLSGGNWFIATLEHIVSGVVTVDEIVKVTNVSGTTWTVVRAQENTGAVSWVAGDTVALLPTAGGLAQFMQPGAVYGSCTVNSSFEIICTTLVGNLQIANFNSGAGATSLTYWRGDGTWDTPPGTIIDSYLTSAINTTSTTLSNTGLSVYLSPGYYLVTVGLTFGYIGTDGGAAFELGGTAAFTSLPGTFQLNGTANEVVVGGPVQFPFGLSNFYPVAPYGSDAQTYTGILDVTSAGTVTVQYSLYPSKTGELGLAQGAYLKAQVL